MPSGGGGGEKTEAATPKRKKDEREKGNVFTSKEVAPLVGLFAVVYVLKLTSVFILGAFNKAFQMFWGGASSLEKLHLGDVRVLYTEAIGVFAVCALPALLMAGLVAVVLTLFQTKGLFAWKAIMPKFSKLNPISGLKRMFSLRGVMELLKSILKIVILAYVIYNQYIIRFAELPRLMEMDFLHILEYTGGFILDILSSVAAIYIFLVAGDYMFQRWQYEKDLRMSKQEIKEEYKQTEGDPQIKGKIREKQRQMSMSRMMQSVPDADVVVRNPTHYAVAIKYVPRQDTAPVVLAKGADLTALRIVKVAEENDVMVVENRSLARGLFEAVPLDSEIPGDYYQAVAEVLAFVYSARDKATMIRADLERKS